MAKCTAVKQARVGEYTALLVECGLNKSEHKAIHYARTAVEDDKDHLTILYAWDGEWTDKKPVIRKADQL